MNQIGWTDRRRTFTATETVRDQQRTERTRRSRHSAARWGKSKY